MKSPAAGFSLVEALIALGVLSIGALNFAQLVKEQQKEIKAMSESLSAIEVRTALTQVLTKNQTCLFNLTSPSPRTFNANLVSVDNPQHIMLNKILTHATAQAPAIVELNKAIPSSHGLVVDEIKLSIIGQSGTTFNAEWVIGFDRKRAVRAMKKIKIPVIVHANLTNPSAATISSCQNGEAPTAFTGEFGGIYSWHRHYKKCSSKNPSTDDCSCPPDFTPHLIIKNGTDDGSKGDDQNIYFCYR